MAREIDLKTLPLETAQGDVKYAELLPAVLNSAPPGGLLPDDMLKRCDVLKPIKDAINSGAASVVLEDAHYQTLRDALGSFRFAFADPALAAFVRDVREAPEVKIAKAGEAPPAT